MARKKQRLAHDDIVVRFAQRLRQVRQQTGLSQRQLAARAKVNANYLGRLERGDAAPGLDMIGRLALALGVTADALILEPEGVEDGAFSTASSLLMDGVNKVVAREDLAAVRSLAVLVGLVNEALARRGK